MSGHQSVFDYFKIMPHSKATFWTTVIITKVVMWIYHVITITLVFVFILCISITGDIQNKFTKLIKYDP